MKAAKIKKRVLAPIPLGLLVLVLFFVGFLVWKVDSLITSSPHTVKSKAQNALNNVCGYNIESVELTTASSISNNDDIQNYISENKAPDQKICKVTVRNGSVDINQDLYITCTNSVDRYPCDKLISVKPADNYASRTYYFACDSSMNQVDAFTYTDTCLNEQFPQHFENGKPKLYKSYPLFPTSTIPTDSLTPIPQPTKDPLDSACGYNIENVELTYVSSINSNKIAGKYSPDQKICKVTVNNGSKDPSQNVYIQCLQTPGNDACQYIDSELFDSARKAYMYYSCPDTADKVKAFTFNQNCITDQYLQHIENGAAKEYPSNSLSGYQAPTPTPQVIIPTLTPTPANGRIGVSVNMSGTAISSLGDIRFLKFTLLSDTGAELDSLFIDAKNPTPVKFTVMPGKFAVVIDDKYLYDDPRSGNNKTIYFQPGNSQFTHNHSGFLNTCTKDTYQSYDNCSILIHSGEYAVTFNVKLDIAEDP